MSRRTRGVIQGAAAIVIVASLVVARVLSVENGRSGLLGAAQTGLFVAFALAALTLFATVVMDFDRWVDTVPPVPKRPLRRWLGRNARRIIRPLAWLLVLYGVVVSWVWLTTGQAVGWVVSRAGAGMLLLWVLLVRAGRWALVRYRAAASRLWLSGGRGFAWALARVGEGLTWLWVSLVRPGGWALVRYRVAASRLWLSVGRGFAWALARVGEGLTWLWVLSVRAAGWAWAGFRIGMRWLSSSAGRALAWVLGGIGRVFAAVWVWVMRAGRWLLARCGAGISWVWRSTLGRERVTTTSPRRPWYTTAVNSVFGIPPEGTSAIDAVPARRSPRPRPANRPRPLRRPTLSGEPEKLGSRNATGTTSNSALTQDSRARYVGRQVTRRGERRKSEELLAAALARFRSAPRESHDRGTDGDDR